VENPEESAVAAESAAERFLDGAHRRLARLMLALGSLTAPLLWAALGWHFALGFLLGALVAAINYYWLKSIAAAFADVATQTGRHSSAGIVAKSLLRLVLLGVLVYVIFRSSGQVAYGFLAGLFVPVAAMVCEAGYEAWSALRHDI
jgi:hypothetical protein